MLNHSENKEKSRYAYTVLDREGEGGEPPLGRAVLYAGTSIWVSDRENEIMTKMCIFNNFVDRNRTLGDSLSMMSVMKRSYERCYEENNSHTLLSVGLGYCLLGSEPDAHPL